MKKIQIGGKYTKTGNTENGQIIAIENTHSSVTRSEIIKGYNGEFYLSTGFNRPLMQKTYSESEIKNFNGGSPIEIHIEYI